MPSQTFEEKYGITREEIREAYSKKQVKIAHEHLRVDQNLCRSIGLRVPTIEDNNRKFKPSGGRVKDGVHCVGCGCYYDEFDANCVTCRARKAQRVFTEKQREMKANELSG